MRDILTRGKKADPRASSQCHMLTYCAAQHRVAGLQRLENAVSRYRVIDIQRHFAIATREGLQVMRQDDTDHGSVCTSTDRTAGRSRTIACQLSPSSLDA